MLNTIIPARFGAKTGTALLLLVFCGALAGCARHEAASTATPAPAPLPAAINTAVQAAPPVPKSAAVPTAVPSAAPPAVAPPTAAMPSAVIAAPDAPPQILTAALSPAVAAPGSAISGAVTTSSNVASVQARIGGYAADFTKTGVGAFALTYRLPALMPPFLRHAYLVQIIARNSAGVSTVKQLPITIR